MRTREETLSQKERCPFLVLGTHTHPAPQVSEPPVALALPLNARHVCSRRSSTPVRGTGNKRTSQGARTTAAGAVSAPPRPSPPRPRALSNPDSAASSRLIFAEDLVQQCPRPTCSPLGFLPRRPEHAEPTALNRLLWGASLHSAPGRIPPPPKKKVGPIPPRPTDPARPHPIPAKGAGNRGGSPDAREACPARATSKEAPTGPPPTPRVRQVLPPPRVRQASTYRSGPGEKKARARAPEDSVFRPGRKVCAI